MASTASSGTPWARPWEAKWALQLPATCPASAAPHPPGPSAGQHLHAVRDWIGGRGHPHGWRAQLDPQGAGDPCSRLHDAPPPFRISLSSPLPRSPVPTPCRVQDGVGQLGTLLFGRRCGPAGRTQEHGILARSAHPLSPRHSGQADAHLLLPALPPRPSMPPQHRAQLRHALQDLVRRRPSYLPHPVPSAPHASDSSPLPRPTRPSPHPPPCLSLAPPNAPLPTGSS